MASFEVVGGIVGSLASSMKTNDDTTLLKRGTRRRVDEHRLLEEAGTLSDEALLELHLEGCETAFALLLQRYERELYSYLRRMVVEPTLAEDVFQNTFFQVHQKRHLYASGRPFRPWLYTIATNQAIDALRRNQRHQRPSLDNEAETGKGSANGTLLDVLASVAPDPHDAAERSERRELIRRSVDTLAEHLRAVVVLSYYQGMKYKEIAEILDIPVGTVKSRLHAAIKRLAECWQEAGLPTDES